MQVFFEVRDPAAASLRAGALERVRFVLRRLSWLVGRASIHLSDLNGPRGGLDKRCQVRLTAGAHGTVVMTAVARDWRAAIDMALGGAVRLLRRLVTRRRQALLAAPGAATPMMAATAPRTKGAR